MFLGVGGAYMEKVVLGLVPESLVHTTPCYLLGDLDWSLSFWELPFSHLKRENAPPVAP